MNIQMMYIVTILLFISITARVSFPQEPIEFLGLDNEKITSLSLYSGVIAVGTDRNGVFWQFESLLTDISWIHIELDSQSVQTVYAHKSGPLGWAISAGVAPDKVDSVFIYCSFMGGDFIPNSVGIMDSLTDKVSELDGFPDPTICGETYAAGGKALYRRGFTGSSWTPVYTASIEGYFQTVKVKEQYPGIVLAGGAEGFAGFLLIKSTDYGENWADISPPGTVYSIDFAGESAETIFTAVSEKIYKSADGGNSWQAVFDGEGLYHLTEVLYDPETKRVFAAGGDRFDNGQAILLFSDDDGGNWQLFSLEMNGPIIDLEFGNGWTYFVTPDDGIFRFQDLIVEVDEEIRPLLPTEFQLSQNYPNPFNASTVIGYSIPEATKVVLTVYNSLGQKIANLLNQDQPSGNYVIRWDASSVNSGVYFYVLSASGRTLVRKTLVLK